MPQSLSKIYVHLVFSTKGRTETIPKTHLAEVHAYVAEIFNNWQEGYGAFSVSNSHVDAVINYIKGQEEHHKKVSFQDEFRKICQLYKAELDERYAWD